MNMRKIKYFAALMLAAFAVSCHSGVDEADNSVTYVEAADSDETVIAKAVATRPSRRQMTAMDREFIAFVHFGPNTFTGREWGTGREDPSVFNPVNLDTDQWCRVMKDAGMKMVILTVKHHDGFVLWQSRYTSHGIMSSPFMGGKGDVLRSLSESCRKYGLDLGIYLSPADLYQMESPEGLYGNGSAKTMRTIPREVEGRPFANHTRFNFELDDYNEYYLNQLFEILTEYGPIKEVWLDGAHPARKGDQRYNYTAWRELIRTLVPDAVVFGREDIRWCGNESGDTRAQEWNVIAYAQDPNIMTEFHDITEPDLGSREALLAVQRPFYLHYQPTETDTSIRDGWFYRNDDEQYVRSADEVFDIWERTVGGNAIFILNVPPTTEGVLGERDAATLAEVGRRIRAAYGENLLASAAQSINGSEAVVKLPQAVEVNRFEVREPVFKTGERIEEFVIEAMLDGEWVPVYHGHNVGRRHIARFSTVRTDSFRLRVLQSRAKPEISDLGAYLVAD